MNKIQNRAALVWLQISMLDILILHFGIVWLIIHYGIRAFWKNTSFSLQYIILYTHNFTFL